MSKNNLINSLFRPEVLALSAYHVADAAGFIKLDAMENPYTWSDDFKQQWLAELKDCELNRYPDPEARQLNATAYVGVSLRTPTHSSTRCFRWGSYLTPTYIKTYHD